MKQLLVTASATTEGDNLLLRECQVRVKEDQRVKMHLEKFRIRTDQQSTPWTTVKFQEMVSLCKSHPAKKMMCLNQRDLKA